MIEHSKIRNILVNYINLLSKEELSGYVGDLHNQNDNENQGMSLGISEYAAERNYENSARAVSIITHSLCSNQGQLIQFMFLAAEKHKKLRLLWNSSKNPDVHELEEHVVALRDYIDNSVQRIVDTNIQYLYQYFQGRSAAQPRICVKGKSLVGEEAKIVRVFSNSPLPYNSDIDIDNSTAYKYIEDNGQYYIQNHWCPVVEKVNAIYSVIK